jgi:hypothetical protein
MKKHGLIHLAITILMSSCTSTGKSIEPSPTLAAQSGQYPRVDSDLNEFDIHVAALKEVFTRTPANPNDKEWVKVKIAHMVEVDQYMRKYSQVVHEHNYSEQEQNYFSLKFGPRWQSIDEECTASIKELLKIYPWFTISEFGAVTDGNAWLIVQHADLDSAFQKQVLIILKQLYPKGETSRRNYAYLDDRVAIAEKRPQLFGTQGQCVGPGKWEPHPIEDPSNVDKRRAEMELGTMAEYIAVFKDICKKGD